MAAPRVLFHEAPALDRIQDFILAACPELGGRENVYRQRPAASPSRSPAPSATIGPTTPAPVGASLFGEQNAAGQRQRWRLVVTTAASGSWDLQLLGEPTAYVAGGGDDAATIRDGIQAALAALGAPVTMSVPANPPAALEVLGDAAGVSLGLRVTPAAGGARSLAVVDDCIRVAVYDWGTWTIRVVFRDVPSAERFPVGGVRYYSTELADRLRCYFLALDMPVVVGEAYPTLRDLLESSTGDGEGPALRAVKAYGPFPGEEQVEGGAWVRSAAVDLVFQVPIALTYDGVSMDEVEVPAGAGSLSESG